MIPLRLFLFLFAFNFMSAQVGIQTTLPQASLDIAKSTVATSSNQPQGVLVPRMSGDELKVMSVGVHQNSMLVYATSAATSSTGTKAEYVDSAGYYYYLSNIDRFVKFTHTAGIKGCYVNGVYGNLQKNDLFLGLSGVNSDKYHFILNETGSNLQATTITGVEAGIDGQMIKISTQQHNFGITFRNLDNASSAENQINCSAFAGQGNLTINSRGYATFMYQVSDKKWHLIDFRINNP